MVLTFTGESPEGMAQAVAMAHEQYSTFVRERPNISDPKHISTTSSVAVMDSMYMFFTFTLTVLISD